MGARSAGEEMKSGEIYLHKKWFTLGIMRRSRSLWDGRKWAWELEQIASVYPQDFNRGFVKDIKTNHVKIGEL